MFYLEILFIEEWDYLVIGLVDYIYFFLKEDFGIYILSDIMEIDLFFDRVFIW